MNDDLRPRPRLQFAHRLREGKLPRAILVRPPCNRCEPPARICVGWVVEAQLCTRSLTERDQAKVHHRLCDAHAGSLKVELQPHARRRRVLGEALDVAHAPPRPPPLRHKVDGGALVRAEQQAGGVHLHRGTVVGGQQIHALITLRPLLLLAQRVRAERHAPAQQPRRPVGVVHAEREAVVQVNQHGCWHHERAWGDIEREGGAPSLNLNAHLCVRECCEGTLGSPVARQGFIGDSRDGQVGVAAVQRSQLRSERDGELGHGASGQRARGGLDRERHASRTVTMLHRRLAVRAVPDEHGVARHPGGWHQLAGHLVQIPPKFDWQRRAIGVAHHGDTRAAHCRLGEGERRLRREEGGRAAIDRLEQHVHHARLPHHAHWPHVAVVAHEQHLRRVLPHRGGRVGEAQVVARARRHVEQPRRDHKVVRHALGLARHALGDPVVRVPVGARNDGKLAVAALVGARGRDMLAPADEAPAGVEHVLQRERRWLARGLERHAE
mmetsp:Transcript_6246/g.16293  ORF Transcript_6246/g.16293 Transcript_6246/m.16293 type:complete len:496 (-) Transcript_6246:1054-2541(-)